MDLGSQARGIATLADATRRGLYEYVVAQDAPVGREQAATALALAQHTANFHLDKLVDEGLLQAEFRRPEGRTGPGAGRPSKFYRRSDQEWSISLPERRYDLVGHILAAGVERAGRDGVPLDEALDAAARDQGTALGESAGGPADLRRFAAVLGSQGYEPQVDEDAVVTLANCPFDALAKQHTALVCGLNRSYVQGVADGLGCDRIEAELAPEPGRCCVQARESA